MRITVASYNIQYGVGQDGRYDLDRVIEVIKDADIVCLQEVAQHFKRNDDDDQPAMIAGALNRYYVYGALFDVDASRVAPGGRVENRRRTFGNMVLSRWPIRSHRTLALPMATSPGIHDVPRSVTEAVVLTPAGALRAYSVHLSHISSGQRLPQAWALRKILFEAPWAGSAIQVTGTGPEDGWTEGLADPFPPVPGLIAGDFNCTAESPEYAVLCGEKDPERGRIRQHDQWVDSWVAAGGHEHAPTSFYKHGHNFKIDHVLMTPDLAAGVSRSWIDTDEIASDHYPLFVELDWAG